ncbi:metalloproteinase inhibitor 2-like [Stigmatopora nigra]
MNNLVLTLLLLHLVGLREVVRGCSCFPTHPQQSFCQADFAMKAVILKRTDVNTAIDFTDFGFNNIKYDIQVLKLFKGPKMNLDAVYTGSNSAACGIHLINGTEYFLSGYLDLKGFLHVSLCGFVQRWEDLSSTQKRGVEWNYKNGCNCKITRCASIPCGSTFAECLWSDYQTLAVFRHFACVEKSDGSCAWFRGIA